MRFPVGLRVYIKSPWTSIQEGTIVKETLQQGGSRIDTQWSKYVYTVETIAKDRLLFFEYDHAQLMEWNRQVHCRKRWFHRHSASCFYICLPVQGASPPPQRLCGAVGGDA